MKTLKVPAVRGWGFGLLARAALVYALWDLLNMLRPGWAIGSYAIETAVNKVYTATLPFFQKRILGMEQVSRFVESDAAARVYFLHSVLFALLVGGIWLLVDRRRKHEVGILETARVVSRYATAGMLFYYAGEKFFGSQGGWALTPGELIAPYGHITGFAAMMSWLSYSSVYLWFSGWAECGAGLLMFSRRFTTLAATLCLADMGMVWLINQSYWDHWGAAAFSPIHFVPPVLFLLAPHARRFVDFFVKGKPSAMTFDEITPSSWLARGWTPVKVVVSAWTFYVGMVASLPVADVRHQASPLYGVYRVERFERNGVAEPWSDQFPERWREVGINRRADHIAARLVNGTEKNVFIEWPSDPNEKRNDLSPFSLRGYLSVVKYTAAPAGKLPLRVIPASGDTGAAPRADTLSYAIKSPTEVDLTGSMNGVAYRIVLRRLAFDSLPYFRVRWKPI